MGKSAPNKITSPTFTITCVILATIGFAQLMAVAVAAALRSGETREIVKYVEAEPIVVSIPTLPDEPPAPKNIEPRTEEQLIRDYAGNYTPKTTPAQPRTARPLNLGQNNDDPPISNPQIRRLIGEAHQLHLDGDIVRALLKLDEASDINPDEPAVVYRKALVFQDMGHWQKAGDQYEKLFGMGPSIGAYYHRAALALAHGVAPKVNNQGLMILGNIIPRTNKKRTSAKLTIPVRATIEQPIDPELVEIKIHFYDLVDGQKIEPVPNQRRNNISYRWLSAPADWKQAGEETLQATYTLPPLPEAEVHLFGNRKYFGHVAELYYKGELLDQQASPRKLHAHHAAIHNRAAQPRQPLAANRDLLPPLPDAELPPGPPLDFGNEEPLPNINPGNPLLPPLPRK